MEATTCMPKGLVDATSCSAAIAAVKDLLRHQRPKASKGSSTRSPQGSLAEEISDGCATSWHHMASYGTIVQVHGTINWTSWACFEILLVITCKRAYRVAFHCQFSTRWFCYANASAHVRRPSTAPHPWSYEMLDSLNALVQRFRFRFKHHQHSHRNGFKMV